MNDIKVPPFTDGQKKLIEMTEKLAVSRKFCDVDDIDDAQQTISMASTKYMTITKIAQYIAKVSTMRYMKRRTLSVIGDGKRG